MRPFHGALVAGALALLGACGSGSGGGGGGGSALVGVWEYSSGLAFSDEDFQDESLPASPRWLVLESSGDARLVQQEPTSGVVVCRSGIFTATNDSVFFQFDLDFDRPTLVFLRDHPDAQTLELVDASGGSSTFVRRSALPPEYECRSLTTVSRHDGLPETPDFFTGLAWNGASLFFTTAESEVVPVDRTTGLVGAPLPFGFDQFRVVHASQGVDFWVTCACGHNQQAQRKTAVGALVDTVDTLLDLGEEMGISAMAFDPAAGVLTLQGGSFSLQSGRMMAVSSDAEPDVLVQTVDFDARLRSMTWDGTWLWGITITQHVVQIDPVTLDAVATFESPDPTVDWAGIASAPATVGGGNSLFLIGEDESTQDGVLIEVQP